MTLRQAWLYLAKLVKEERLRCRGVFLCNIINGPEGLPYTDHRIAMLAAIDVERKRIDKADPDGAPHHALWDTDPKSMREREAFCRAQAKAASTRKKITKK